MLIRALHAADAAAFQTLRLQALLHDSQAYLTDHETESKKPTSRFASELQYAGLLPPFGYYGGFVTTDDVTESDAAAPQLIGYAQFGHSGLSKQRHVAWVYNLYIDPHHRGQGHAAELLQHIKHLALQHGIEQLVVSCLAQNQPAYRFYQKMQFQRCGLRKRSVKWQDTYDDEIEMVCFLNEPT